MNEIALRSADAGSSPSGTGSFNYFTNFSVVVQNIAFTKNVGVWGHSDTWSFFPCTYAGSVAGNSEVWQTHVSETEIDQFALEYQVAGNIYWDNNSGYDYRLATGPAHTDGVGTVALNSNVLVVGWEVDAGGQLTVDVLVKNIAFQKQVAIVYTTNQWQTFQNAFCTHKQDFPPVSSPHQPNAELWNAAASVGVSQHGQFAIFYIVDGVTYWDNNFGSNYLF